MANLAVTLFDFPNVRQQKRVLNLEKRFGTDESQKSAIFIHQQDVIVEICVGTRKHGAQDIADWRRYLDTRFLFAKMVPDRLARPERKTVASAK